MCLWDKNVSFWKWKWRRSCNHLCQEHLTRNWWTLWWKDNSCKCRGGGQSLTSLKYMWGVGGVGGGSWHFTPPQQRAVLHTDAKDGSSSLFISLLHTDANTSRHTSRCTMHVCLCAAARCFTSALALAVSIVNKYRHCNEKNQHSSTIAR